MDVTYLPDPLTAAGRFTIEDVTYSWDPKDHGYLSFELNGTKVLLSVVPVEHQGLIFGSSKWPGLKIWVDGVYIKCCEVTGGIEPRKLREAVEAALWAWNSQAILTKKAALAKLG